MDSELLFTFPSNQNHKDTNFAIEGFLAGLHRSPLICLCFQDLLATFGNVEDSFSPLIIQALSVVNTSFYINNKQLIVINHKGVNFVLEVVSIWLGEQNFGID